MNDYIKMILISLVMSALAFSAGVSYTKAVSEKSMIEITDLLAGYAKVQTFNPEEISKRITSEGATPAELASYIERYIKLHQLKGVMLIDESYVVAKPNFSSSATLTMSELNNLSEKYSIKTEIDYGSLLSEFNKTIKSAKNYTN